MPRSKKGAGKGPPSQGVKDTQSLVRDAKKRAREILKQAGKNVRTVRHEVSELKKAGLVSRRVDVRHYLPTKYMMRKIAQNRDVLSGEAVAVKAPRKVREKYAGIFEPRGSNLIVPREYQNQKTRITRGMVELRRDLRMGEEVRLVLPFKAADMEGIAHKLLADPSLNGMKRGNELFGFRLFGHNMNTIGFPNTEELADYILRNYAHLFSGKNGREGVKHFQLFRFRSRRSQLKQGPEDAKVYSPRKRKEYQGRERDFIIRKRLERDAARKAKLRAKETPAQHKKRIEAQRIRQAQLRQRKWEDK
jgi:hypothetical protein